MTNPLLSARGAAAAVVLAGASLALAAEPAQTPAPAAPVREVTDTYAGTPLVDPYRWLEDARDPATVAWMRAATARAEATLASIPGHAALLARLSVLNADTGATVGRVLRTAGGLYVYERRGAGDAHHAIVARQGHSGRDRVLVDPAALSRARGGASVAVNHFSVSPDGRYLAYGASEGGSEAAELQLIDVATGDAIGEPVAGARFGIARWAPDSRRFAFTRLRETAAGRRDAQAGSAVWVVPVPGGIDKARELLGPGTPSAALAPGELPTVLFTADGRWLLGFVEDGVRREVRVVRAAADGPAGDAPSWTPLVDTGDRVVDFAYGSGTFYATTHDGAPRYRVVAAPIERFAMATAATVVPASGRVLGPMVAARDALYLEARDGNAKQLWRLPYGDDARPAPVELPLAGTFHLRRPGGVWAAHGGIDGVLIALEDWSRAPRVFEVDADGRVVDTGLQPGGRADLPDDIETRDVVVIGHDGARVPMSIVHRRGLDLDGRNPTLLQGYGAYGATWEARFDASRLAWLERGGVIAVVNPRGSGVFGHDWYEAGKQATKANTWRDMIACAEYLVSQGYAAPATLAVEGSSAGAIAAGRAATERPDLFAAVVLRVGLLDAVRAELEPNGPANVPEFGTHTTAAGFEALRAMSTYHHIDRGTRYPAVLLLHGVNDPRVAVSQSAKTAARFAAASASVPDGRAVLLRLDFDAGHGVGSTQRQRERETADVYAFLLWQMGVAGFQPRRP